MFELPHHQRIAQVLLTLDGSLLREWKIFGTYLTQWTQVY